MTNQTLVDRFCESPRRWLIVTAVTAVVALAMLLPLAEQYQSLRADESEKAEELAEAGRIAEQLETLRTRVAETTERLDALKEQTLTGEGVARFRARLVDAARESGCPVRRLSVGAVRTRRWREGDHPLDAEAAAEAGRETPYNLETRTVNLTVTGRIAEIRKLLEQINNVSNVMHPKKIDLRPTSDGNANLQLDLELWCFALTRNKGKA